MFWLVGCRFLVGRLVGCWFLIGRLVGCRLLGWFVGWFVCLLRWFLKDQLLQVRQVAEYYSEYKQCFEGAGTNPGEKTLEDKFFEYEVKFKFKETFLFMSRPSKIHKHKLMRDPDNSGIRRRL